MKRQLILAIMAVMLIFSLVAVGCAPKAPAELPEVLTLATMPPGMNVNAQAVGIADLCGVYTPISLKVKPATNEMVWMPMTLTGEVDLGVAVAVAIRQAYLGTFVFEGIAQQAGVKSFPVRLVAAGSPMRINMFVRGDDPAKKIADLKGRRICRAAVGTHFELYVSALLANGGLTWDDVTEVPIANPIEVGRAIMEGRADSGQLGVGAPIAVEAVAKVNARWLPVDTSPEAVKRMQDIVDIAYVATVPGGEHIGIPEPQPLMHIDTVFVAREDISEAAVYELTKALWEHNSELVGKPGLSEWTQDRFLTTTVRVPYHDGAIKFYKEIGLWTKEMEELQKAVLAEKP